MSANAKHALMFFTLLACIVGGQQLVVRQITTEVAVNRSVGSEIVATLADLKEGQKDRWTADDHRMFVADMINWIDEFKKLNPDMKFPKHGGPK